MSKPVFSRRDWLKFAGAGVASSALVGCASWLPRSYSRPLSAQPFARPQIGEDLIIRTRVGLRPFRPSGFNVKGEKFGEKLVIHNYGHGGAGITLSWGSSMLAVREMPDIADRRAAVLGCGVMGLSTARLLQARGWQVTIYAKDLPPNTTSNVAGGLWAPTSVHRLHLETPEFAAQLSEALTLSHAEFSKLVGGGYGVSWREDYYLSRGPLQPQDFYYLERWPALFPSIAVLSPDEHPFAAPFVMRHLTLLIEPSIYLPRMVQDVRDAGGNIVVREMQSLGEVLALDEPVVFNCTGLGARDLFGDAELLPVRGQLVFMPADSRVDYCTHGSGEGLLYMFPREDGILLGGTYEYGATHLEPDAETTARIVREHLRLSRGMRV
ncbi:MAG: FAD-dependent oxidoreductase [Betaproteobacteria bacterium]